jgi:Teichoic acid biosynthesis proteins
VGAVFDPHGGTKIKAPEWIATLGVEWIFRLFQEPKRLLRSYLIDNFLFII